MVQAVQHSGPPPPLSPPALDGLLSALPTPPLPSNPALPRPSQWLAEAKAAAAAARQERLSSRYTGVDWNKATQKYRVQLVVNGRKSHLGLYADEQQAARVYDRAVVLRDGRWARVPD